MLTATSPAMLAVALAQHDGGERLLVIIQRGVKGFESISERLHLLGALGHALAGAIEPIGQ
jgi:hypothetical protein